MTKGDKCIKLLESLKQSQGSQWANKPLKLSPWQKDLIYRIFDQKNEDGFRLIREAFIFVPRKNGKTTFIAGLLIFLILFDGEAGAQIYCCSPDTTQSLLVFKEACNMIKQSSFLSSKLKPIPSKREIHYADKMSFIKALSAEAYSKHGLNPSCVVFDELHAMPDRELYDVMTSGMGARQQPLTISITTAGFNQNGICKTIYDYAKQVAKGEIKDPTFLSFIAEAEAGDDPFAEDTWKKANPNYGVTVLPSFMKSAAQKARDIPSEYAKFCAYNLNIWTDTDKAWLQRDKWQALQADFPLEVLKGLPCWVGVDLASVNDLACVSAVFYYQNRLVVLCKHYTPRGKLQTNMRLTKQPYDVWEREKHLTVTDSESIDYDVIRDDIIALNSTYRVKEVAIDRWNANHLGTQLEKARLKVFGIGMGYASMSEPAKYLEKAIADKKICHFNDPVLNWQIGNVVLDRDAKDNICPNKAKSSEKIDAVVATICGIARYLANKKPDESVYKSRGIISL
jgi:phage terminase large subunit-like protein